MTYNTAQAAQAGWRFNAPPGWHTPSAAWVPPTGWTPDPAWPAAPEGWEFWVAIPDPRLDALRNPHQPPSPAGWLFRPPPGWPALPDPYWQPPQGWSPGADLPLAPRGWVFWERDPNFVPFQIVRGWSPVDRTRLRYGGGGLLFLGIALMAQGEAAGLVFGVIFCGWGLAVWVLTGFGFIPFTTLGEGKKWVVGIGSVIGLLFVYTFLICFIFTLWLIKVVVRK